MGTVKNVKVACQTFTWEMLGEGWNGGPDDLLQAIAQGGYAGIEITDTMIGSYADNPVGFAARLRHAGCNSLLSLSARKSGFAR